MKKILGKRLIAVLCAALMVVSYLPAAALAEDFSFDVSDFAASLDLDLGSVDLGGDMGSTWSEPAAPSFDVPAVTETYYDAPVVVEYTVEVPAVDNYYEQAPQADTSYEDPMAAAAAQGDLDALAAAAAAAFTAEPAAEAPQDAQPAAPASVEDAAATGSIDEVALAAAAAAKQPAEEEKPASKEETEEDPIAKALAAMANDYFDVEEAYRHYMSLATAEEKEAYLRSLSEIHRQILVEYIRMKEQQNASRIDVEDRIDDCSRVSSCGSSSCDSC